jgi:Domain of unknown function (DUF4148)
MKAKHLIAAVAVFAATGSVFAQQTEFVAPEANFVSTKSRAQVVADLKASKANGDYVVGGREYVAPAAHFASTKTRAQVIAELKQSEGDGSYALAHQEYVDQSRGLDNSSHTSTQFARASKAANRS